MLIGIISDTHGLLRPEVHRAFAGVDQILHAGDVGGMDILIELETIAPVTAVWGNTDGWEMRDRLPEIATLNIGEVAVVVLHGQQLGSPNPALAARAYPDADLVIFGHSHIPVIEKVGSVMAVNPGSAGPRRFKQPVTVAIARIEGERLEVELVALLP